MIGLIAFAVLAAASFVCGVFRPCRGNRGFIWYVDIVVVFGLVYGPLNHVLAMRALGLPWSPTFASFLYSSVVGMLTAVIPVLFFGMIGEVAWGNARARRASNGG